MAKKRFTFSKNLIFWQSMNKGNCSGSGEERLMQFGELLVCGSLGFPDFAFDSVGLSCNSAIRF